jgi:hypothetical protein
MGLSDELTDLVGDGVVPYIQERRRWLGLCVCGHISTQHSQSVGGEYIPAPLTDTTPPTIERFDGCRGALAGGRKPTEEYVREGDVIVKLTLATCPCERFRPIAKVDRPGRFFNQAIPRDREDYIRHPFLTGIRAYRTRISKFKAIDGDPVKTAAELDRRFEWLPGARICSISRCKATDDVWPVFVSEGSDGTRSHSELRCLAHR